MPAGQVIDLTCAAEDFSPLLLPFARRAVREIGHRFREGTAPGRLPARNWLSLTDTERAVAADVVARQGTGLLSPCERARRRCP